MFLKWAVPPTNDVYTIMDSLVRFACYQKIVKLGVENKWILYEGEVSMKGRIKPSLIITTRICITIFLLVLLKTTQTAVAMEPQDYELYSNQQLGISLNKPKQWEVFVLNGTIFIKPSYDSRVTVFLIPILRAHPKMQALSFIYSIY